MTRIRSIKPETWTDTEFVACSPLARLLWIGMWNHADDYGVLKDDPGALRLRVLPADDVDAASLVSELVEHRLVLRRVAPDGTPVLVVRSFCMHQKIDKRSTGRYGTPDQLSDPDGSPPSPTVPTESPPIPTNPAPGVEGKGREKEGTSSTSDVRRADVDVLCDALVELVVANGARKPNITREWRTQARLLLDRDGVELGEAQRVMRWACEHEFWKSNVLSMPTFREKYDRLKLQANGAARPVRLSETGRVRG